MKMRVRKRKFWARFHFERAEQGNEGFYILTCNRTYNLWYGNYRLMPERY